MDRRIELLEHAAACIASEGQDAWRTGMVATLMKSVKSLAAFGRSKERNQFDLSEGMLYQTFDSLISAYDGLESSRNNLSCSQGGSQEEPDAMSDLSRLVSKVSSSDALGVLVERVTTSTDVDPEAQELGMVLLAGAR